MNLKWPARLLSATAVLILGLVQTTAADNWPECAGVAILTAKTTTQNWPAAQTRPITADTDCTVIVSPDFGEELILTITLVNVDPGAVYFSPNLRLNGTAKFEIMNPTGKTLYIKGSVQQTAGATFQMSYIGRPIVATQAAIEVGLRQSYLLSYLDVADEGTTTFGTGTNNDLVALMTYFDVDKIDYELNDRIAGFRVADPPVPLFSGTDLVNFFGGVEEIQSYNLSIYWNPLPNYHANIVIYATPRLASDDLNKVQWRQYVTKAWPSAYTQFSLSDVAENSPVATVFLRRGDIHFAGIVTNVVANCDRFLIYKNVAEVSLGGINGEVVSIFRGDGHLALDFYVDASYTFVVQGGSVTFLLSETTSPAFMTTTSSPLNNNWPECINLVAELEPNFTATVWPTQTMNDPRLVDVNTFCFVEMHNQDFTVLYLTVVVQNMDPGVVTFLDGSGMVGNATVTQIRTGGSLVTVDGGSLAKGNSAATFVLSMVERPVLESQRPIFVPPGEFYFTSWQWVTAETSMTLKTSGDTSMLVVMIVYFGRGDDSVKIDNRAGFYFEGTSFGDASDFVYGTHGVSETFVNNVTVYWAPDPAYQAAMLFYSAPKIVANSVDEVGWQLYNILAWETLTYTVQNSLENPATVFLRNGNYSNVGNITNVVLSPTATLRVYEGIAEVSDTETRGDLVALWRAGRDPVIQVKNFASMAYTFVVQNGQATFDLTEVVSPDGPPPSTSTVAYTDAPTTTPTSAPVVPMSTTTNTGPPVTQVPPVTSQSTASTPTTTTKAATTASTVIPTTTRPASGRTTPLLLLLLFTLFTTAKI